MLANLKFNNEITMPLEICQIYEICFKEIDEVSSRNDRVVLGYYFNTDSVNNTSDIYGIRFNISFVWPAINYKFEDFYQCLVSAAKRHAEVKQINDSDKYYGTRLDKVIQFREF